MGRRVAVAARRRAGPRRGDATPPRPPAHPTRRVAGGFLSDRYLGRPDPVPPLENRSLVKYRLIIEEFGGWDRFQEMLAALGRIAERRRATIGAVAIRWVLDQPNVAGAIVGARHARHLDQIRKACEIALDEADRREIAR